MVLVVESKFLVIRLWDHICFNRRNSFFYIVVDMPNGFPLVGSFPYFKGTSYYYWPPRSNVGPMPNASLVHIFPMAPLGGGSTPPRGDSGLLKNKIWSFKGRRLYFRNHRKGNVGQSLAEPNGTSNGPWSEPPRGGSPTRPPWGGPPSGPHGGPLKRRFPCNLCYPLPILVAILALTLITPPLTKKVLLYPRYGIGFDLDVHIWVFRKAINASGKWNNVDIINLFYLILCDDIFWIGGKCHAKSPKLCFWWIRSYFLQTLLKGSKKRTSLHGALHVIKQKVDEKVEV